LANNNIFGSDNDRSTSSGCNANQADVKWTASTNVDCERRMADIIDFLPDATFAIDLNGKVIVWNRAAEEMTGVKAENILGKGDYEYAIPFYGTPRPMLIDLVLEPNNYWETTYTTIKREGKALIGENLCHLIDGDIFIWGKAAYLFDSMGNLIGAIESIRNITRRKMAEVSQAQELKKFQVLYDLAVAMSAEQTLDDNLQLIIKKSQELFSADASFIALRDESRSQVYMQCLSGIRTQAFKDMRFAFGVGIGGFIAETHQGYIIENYLRDPMISHELDCIIANEGLVTVMAAPIQIGNNKIGVLYVANRSISIFEQADLDALATIGNLAAVQITRKRFEEDLEQRNLELAELNTIAATLSHKLIQAQEDERRHLARELHDDFGQTLTAVKINLQSIMQIDGAPCAKLLHSIKIVDVALQGIRRLSLSLRPSILDDLGLDAALRWHLDNMTQMANLNTQYRTNLAGRRLPPILEICCFRIIQEALTNVVRHARAQSVLVELTLEKEQLQLLIQDDGAGFDVVSALNAAARGRSLGLLGLQERVSLAGGKISITSSRDGSGTTIQVFFQQVIPESPAIRLEEEG
jgi:PAS domain S-box-containing protein